MTIGIKEHGKLIVDQDSEGNRRFTYWNADHLVYVRDGGNYDRSNVGPHFLDLGVMGKCVNYCCDCYMRGKQTGRNIDYPIADEIVWNRRHTLCQVSFGGAGDPFDYPYLFDLSRLGEGSLRRKYGAKENEARFRDEELLEGITKCLTINPRNRAYTVKEVAKLEGFKAVGLSCGEYYGQNEINNIENLIRQIEDTNWRERPDIVLHLIVGSNPQDPRQLLRLLTYHSVKGLLLLAKKAGPNRRKDEFGAFFDLNAQREFLRRIQIIHDATDVPIAVDSCLAKVIHPDMLRVDRYAMHPCDAGRFSAYIHADEKMWLCSCGEKPVRSWKEALRTAQSCCNVLPPGPGESLTRGFQPPSFHDWANPPVVIQRGPMTNSSSASYFVIGHQAWLSIQIVDFAERREKAKEEIATWEGRFPWTTHNNCLVRLTPHEWAAWCARDIASHKNPTERKKELDKYTARIVDGEGVYYLVANRDDSGIPPTKYKREDVSPFDKIVFFRADGE